MYPTPMNDISTPLLALLLTTGFVSNLVRTPPGPFYWKAIRAWLLKPEIEGGFLGLNGRISMIIIYPFKWFFLGTHT